MIIRDKVELQDRMIVAGLEIFQTRDIYKEDAGNFIIIGHRILQREKRLRVEMLRKNLQVDFQASYLALCTLRAALTID